MDARRLAKKDGARQLRARGYSFLEIAQQPDVQVPRSTVVSWCAGVAMTEPGLSRHRRVVAERLLVAQKNSAASKKSERLSRVSAAESRAISSGPFMDTLASKKAILGALYLAEGTKGHRGGPTFGNSDPEIIRLYLRLLRECFVLDEGKFRCTLQARAGQDIDSLEEFWLRETGIPRAQLYKARIDARGGGQLVRKPDYKGVCRIDYFDANLLYEISAIGRILVQGP